MKAMVEVLRREWGRMQGVPVEEGPEASRRARAICLATFLLFFALIFMH